MLQFPLFQPAGVNLFTCSHGITRFAICPFTLSQEHLEGYEGNKVAKGILNKDC